MKNLAGILVGILSYVQRKKVVLADFHRYLQQIRTPGSESTGFIACGTADSIYFILVSALLYLSPIGVMWWWAHVGAGYAGLCRH